MTTMDRVMMIVSWMYLRTKMRCPKRDKANSLLMEMVTEKTVLQETLMPDRKRYSRINLIGAL